MSAEVKQCPGCLDESHIHDHESRRGKSGAEMIKIYCSPCQLKILKSMHWETEMYKRNWVIPVTSSKN